MVGGEGTLWAQDTYFCLFACFVSHREWDSVCVCASVCMCHLLCCTFAVHFCTLFLCMLRVCCKMFGLNCACIRTHNLNACARATLHVFFTCLCLSLLQCVRAWAHVCLPACSVAMMALFWMIDVSEGAARSSGWARASVWHAAASLLLYICRRSKTPPPLPSDSASCSNTADTHRFPFMALFWSFCLFHESKRVLCAFQATSCFTFYHR